MELSDEAKKHLSETHAELKLMAEREPFIGTRNLATIMMRMIERMRGDDKLTELPQRHHP